MTLLFDPPPSFDLPLSKGGDLIVDFIYRPLLTGTDGDPVLDVNGKKQYPVTDYPTGAVVVMQIDPNISQSAVITGHHATVTVDHALTDPIKPGRLWRQKITYSDGRDVVLCNGKVIRKDGS